jgi:hypothetical protein
MDPLPVFPGLKQPTACFAAGELVDLRLRVTLDHIQRMSTQLWEGLKSDRVVCSVHRTFQIIFEIEG